MQGQAFLGAQKAKERRKYIFSARDRMDEKYDRVRAVRDKQYRYIYNYMPDTPYYQNLTFRLSIPMMKEMIQLRENGTLNAVQMAWFNTKPVEELYDLNADPDELHNLVNDTKYQGKLKELRTAFKDWTEQVGDMSSIPETEMISKWWDGKNEPPSTATPEIVKVPGGIKITCTTKGASIGYRWIKTGINEQPEHHTIRSWDSGVLFDTTKNGKIQTASPAWKIYNNEVLPIHNGFTLKVNAMRIGYKPALADTIY